MLNYEFSRLLHGRGLTVEKLARQILSDRSHVNKCLLGERGRGYYTRRKLFRVLTEGELRALGWWEEYEAFHAEQCGSWEI